MTKYWIVKLRGTEVYRIHKEENGEIGWVESMDFINKPHIVKPKEFRNVKLATQWRQMLVRKDNEAQARAEGLWEMVVEDNGPFQEDIEQ